MTRIRSTAEDDVGDPALERRDGRLDRGAAVTASDAALACATDRGRHRCADAHQAGIRGEPGLGTGASALVIGSVWLLGRCARSAVVLYPAALAAGSRRTVRRIRPDQVGSLYAESSFLPKPETGDRASEGGAGPAEYQTVTRPASPQSTPARSLFAYESGLVEPGGGSRARFCAWRLA